MNENKMNMRWIIIWLMIYTFSLIFMCVSVYFVNEYTAMKNEPDEDTVRALELYDRIQEFNEKQEFFRKMYTPEYNDYDGMYLSDTLIWVPDSCYGSYEDTCVYITTNVYVPIVLPYITEQKYVAIGSDELVH